MATSRDITINRGSLLKLDQPGKHAYGRITLADGGYIEISADCTFTVEELIYDAQPGEGREKNKWGHDIIITGKNGEDAFPGECGGNGLKGADATIQIGRLPQDIYVLNIGGQGGKGGLGAAGAKGGKGETGVPGGPGGNGGDGEWGGNGGNGGNGSKGGSGGRGGLGGMGCAGGDGGDGGAVHVIYTPVGDSKVLDCCKPSKGGSGGAGGSGGPGGYGGDGGPGGPGGDGGKGSKRKQDGQAGSKGQTGEPGESGPDGEKGVPGPDGNPGAPGSIGLTKQQEDGAAVRAVSAPAAAPRLQDLAPAGVTTRLNYADPAHAQYLLDSYGGEAYFAGKYPLLYEAFCKAQELDRTQPPAANAGQASPVRIEAMPPGNNANITRGASESSEYYYISHGRFYYNKLAENANRTLSCVHVQSWMNLGSRRYPCQDEILDGQQALDMLEAGLLGNTQVFINDVAVSTKQNLTANYQMTCYYEGGTSETYANHASLPLEGSTYVVQYMSLDKPKAKIEDQEFIKVTYNRSGGDLSYDWDPSDDGQLISVKLEIEGAIALNPDKYKIVGYDVEYAADPKAPQPTPSMYYSDSVDPIVDYKYTHEDIGKFFKVQEATDSLIKFTYNSDWKNRLPYAKYVVNKLIDVNLSIYIYIKYQMREAPDAGTFTSAVTFMSTSDKSVKPYYKSEKQPYCYLPPLEIVWGCFARDTWLIMENGFHKRIDRIEAGDSVAVRGGVFRRVAQVYTGYDKYVYDIHTQGGRQLKVTDTHPVLTHRGIVRAYELTVEDRMTLPDGGEDAIQFVGREYYDDTVYNIQLEGGGDLLIANGLLAGDNELQNTQLNTESAAVHEPTDYERALLEELRQLRG